jgi:hypothetical protein
MTSTSADRVALVLDCLGHLDTELSGQPGLWRHRDGRYLTEDEAAMIEAECTAADIVDAMALWDAELKQVEEYYRLRAEFLALVRPYRVSSADTIRAAVARLPEAEMKRATEIWQRIGPSFEAWRRDQS